MSSPFQHPPAPPAELLTPLTRPKAVDSAFLLVLAGIVLSLVGTAITTLFDRDRIALLVRDTLDETGTAFNEADVVRLISTFRIIGIASLVIFGALLALVALKMRAGRNWARLLLTVFGAVEMVGFLSAVASDGAELQLIWSLAGVSFTLSAVIYLFRPESIAYFAEVKRRAKR